jgi:hypothetical protein
MLILHYCIAFISRGELQVGNRKLAGFFIEWFEKKGGWGFNFLHKQALLNDGKPFDHYKYRPSPPTHPQNPFSLCTAATLPDAKR